MFQWLRNLLKRGRGDSSTMAITIPDNAERVTVSVYGGGGGGGCSGGTYTGDGAMGFPNGIKMEIETCKQQNHKKG